VPDTIGPRHEAGQPVPFSHKAHLARGLECRTCHVNPDPGRMMTYPATDTCMSCHAVIASDKPSIETLKKLAESGRPIPWKRIYALTEGVQWSHRVHLDAGAACDTCHGDLRQVEVVSESKAILAMASCIGCHQAHAAPTQCVNCHAWPTDELLGHE
jgi:hypothetical protein